ncbi:MULTISPECIES: AzlC family ABC transporter permease [unclassified Selenomonas]|uniref:AzlC family ABC transporter permease n=1 Tax=unclassified Selenomonas TaxID=2637378 RepID=UPI000495B6E1|nr:Predicted branched-chain amino acid permease (azaleucine resistance) [Selenomonas ruminantium]
MQPEWTINRRQVLLEGMRDGLPIALGYFVVSFTLGIAAKNAGLNALEGFFASLFNNASAGEYAGFTVIASGGTLLTMAVLTLVANARYMLMSTVLSQKCPENLPLYHRILVAFDVTDEIFGITIARPGPLNPYYNYGAMLVALPGWSVGTALGIMAGSVLPLSAVSALSVALYGMFIWVIVPQGKNDRIIAVLIVISMLMSLGASLAPMISDLSAGTRTIILTVLIAGLAAYFFPHKEAA